MKQSMCPCLGCGSRNIGCHDKCDKYKSWKAEYDDLSRQIRKKREEQQAQRDCIRASMIRMKEKRRKRDVY